MPLDRSRYPADWNAISKRIRDEAGNRCEWCGVANGAVGQRDRFGTFHEMGPMEAETAVCVDGERVTRIVLTVAHVENPDPMDCRPENLAALCQACHNKLDRPMRQKHAAETRRRKRIASGQAVMPL